MHKSVLLDESIELLNIKEDGVYIDATLGYGGHSEKILEKLKKGFLYCFDQDEDAVKYSEDKLVKKYHNFEIINSNFVNMKAEMEERNISKIDGILFDLGVSSVQLDETARGFSFHKDAPLDMRMDKRQPFSALNVINEYSKEDLIRVFRDYGEEKYAYSIANKIIKYREHKEIETTLELVDIIRSGMPAFALRETHPARRVFQAIRIEVNNELENLETALVNALELLGVGGRVCVITFHSLEDRIVKNIFKKYSETNPNLKSLPFIPKDLEPKYKNITKGITPSDKELEENNRARSSRLRGIEKIKE